MALKFRRQRSLAVAPTPWTHTPDPRCSQPSKPTKPKEEFPPSTDRTEPSRSKSSHRYHRPFSAPPHTRCRAVDRRDQYGPAGHGGWPQTADWCCQLLSRIKMGSVSHHQARSAAFLCRARQASESGDVADAANAMRRSASHAAAALAVNLGMRHNSRRRLEIALHAYISSGQLSRSHVKTFRQVHAFPQYLAAAETRAATRIGGRGCPLRRLRRRVAVLLKDVEAIVAGNPRPVPLSQALAPWPASASWRARLPANHQRARHPRFAQLSRDCRALGPGARAHDAAPRSSRVVRPWRHARKMPVPSGNLRPAFASSISFSLVAHLAEGFGERDGHFDTGYPGCVAASGPQTANGVATKRPC